MRVLKFQAIIVALMFLGCNNPAADKPKAEVKPVSAPMTSAAEPREESGAVDGMIALTPSNTSVVFVGAKVTGSHEGKFERVSGTVKYKGMDPAAAKVTVSIDLSSVKTDSAKLDGHLKSADFFNVEKHPTATFVSSRIEPGSGDAAHTVTGILDLHGEKKEIRFPANFEVSEERVKVKAVFSINRKDFGIVYPGMPDDLIRDDVVLKIAVDAPLH